MPKFDNALEITVDAEKLAEAIEHWKSHRAELLLVKERHSTGPTIKYDGDEYDWLLEEKPCWNCGAPTHFMSVSFMAHICSTECADAKWKEYQEAEAKTTECWACGGSRKRMPREGEVDPDKVAEWSDLLDCPICGEKKMNLFEELEKLRILHFEGDSPSCGVFWGIDEKGECNCGADAHNARLDSVIAYVKENLHERIFMTDDFKVEPWRDGELRFKIWHTALIFTNAQARAIGQALLAAAGGESEKTCATCRFLSEAPDGVFCWNADCPIGKIPAPKDFGCLHWQPAPACKDGEGEQG